MLSKSKIKKLKTDLEGFNVTYPELEGATKKSAPFLRKLLRGNTYDKDAIAALIELRNQKLLEATELESAI